MNLYEEDEKPYLVKVKNTDSLLRANMEIHYSQPKGFVGRDICFSVMHNGLCYGHIVGGSATLNLPNRKEFFPNIHLNNIVNNVFFHIEPIDGRYPIRNFTSFVLKEFRNKISHYWKYSYGDEVVGFESLVEPPRTGECYLRDKWTHISTTKGFTCKRMISKDVGLKPDSYGTSRVWDRENLRPKLVFCRYNK